MSSTSTIVLPDSKKKCERNTKVTTSLKASFQCVTALQSTAIVGKQSEMSEYCTWFRDRLLWATLCADRSPWAQPGVALSNKDEGWETGAKAGREIKLEFTDR